MRIKATFRVEKLPILYCHRFIALIKEALNRSAFYAQNKQRVYPY